MSWLSVCRLPILLSANSSDLSSDFSMNDYGSKIHVEENLLWLELTWKLSPDWFTYDVSPSMTIRELRILEYIRAKLDFVCEYCRCSVYCTNRATSLHVVASLALEAFWSYVLSDGTNHLCPFTVPRKHRITSLRFAVTRVWAYGTNLTQQYQYSYLRSRCRNTQSRDRRRGQTPWKPSKEQPRSHCGP